MPEVTLEFLAQHQERMLTEIGSLRDDMRVQSALIQRIDATLQALIGEIRAIHRVNARTAERVRKLEDKNP